MSEDEILLAQVRGAVDGALSDWLPEEVPEAASSLASAMRYAVLGGGKRIRPVTVVAACQAVGGSLAQALPGACAVELVHAYSLVHDDLPAMDDDVERRGRPTVHVAYDEATAILAGDALLTLAFEVLARPVQGGAPDRQLAAVRELAAHAGRAGLVGGQSLDIALAGETLDSVERLESIHRGKTAALFRVSAAIGGHLGGASSDAQDRLRTYGEALGLAFQHADDILDHEHQQLADQTRKRLVDLLAQAHELARSFGSAGAALDGLADKVDAYAQKGA